MVVRIHPGQSSNPPRVPAAALLALLLGLAVPGPAAGQERPDTGQVLDAVRESQARFERLRRRHSPIAASGWGGRCDEIVGRICLRLEATGDWWPVPDPPPVREGRQELLDRLASAARVLPGDDWILGQRVVYLAEDGRALDGLELLRPCPTATPAWCPALEGFLLHVLHRYPEAEAAFTRALSALTPERRAAWSDPRLLLDRDGRELLDRAPSAERPELERRFWSFADPLVVVEGNDRWTEHLARQVVVRAREDAANPFGLRWGDDLAESLVRYGWEVGWEQLPARPSEIGTRSSAVGHQHPESRSYVPPGTALSGVGRTRWEDWNPGSRYLARTGYAPAYAPVILPAEAQLYRVPRGDSLLLVGAVALPADTSYHRAHAHEPLSIPRRFAGRAPLVGLFALDGTGVVAGARTPGTRGVARIAVPVGEFLVSAEVWAPDSARAGRHREGLTWEGRPPDLPTVSDLFLLDPRGEEPRDLEGVMEGLLIGSTLTGPQVRLAWELYGFGWRRETLSYRVEVRKAPGGFLRRAGRFLGLVGDGDVTTLEWSEAAPGSPGPLLRSALLSFPPEMEPGEYRIRLEVDAPGREPLVLGREFRFRPDSR